MSQSQSTEPSRTDWLFARLFVAYGAPWDSLWAGLDIRAVKADWERELAHVTDDGILYAIEHRPLDRPPNVKQFLALCRGAPMKPLPKLPSPKPSEAEKVKVRAIVGHLKRVLAQQKVARA